MILLFKLEVILHIFYYSTFSSLYIILQCIRLYRDIHIYLHTRLYTHTHTHMWKSTCVRVFVPYFVRIKDFGNKDIDQCFNVTHNCWKKKVVGKVQRKRESVLESMSHTKKHTHTHIATTTTNEQTKNKTKQKIEHLTRCESKNFPDVGVDNLYLYVSPRNPLGVPWSVSGLRGNTSSLGRRGTINPSQYSRSPCTGTKGLDEISCITPDQLYRIPMTHGPYIVPEIFIFEKGELKRKSIMNVMTTNDDPKNFFSK